MTPKSLQVARIEAVRFLDLANEVRIAPLLNGDLYVVNDPKLTGALRRASMDLTRALAEMRRP